MLNSLMHSLRFLGPPLNISGLLECAKRTCQMALHGNAQRHVAYSSNTSFKAHSPPLDSLHLNMSIWLVCSVTSSHKSSPLVRADNILMDVLRKTATLTPIKRDISTICVTIFIYRRRCDLGSTNKPHSCLDPNPRVSLSEGVVGVST